MIFLQISSIGAIIDQPLKVNKDLPISSPSVASLANLINQRLSYMKDVAAYKWVNELSIEDLDRERVVIQSSMKSASLYKLDPASTRNFFEQQIKAAKVIQHYWFKQWARDGFEKDYHYRDLATAIRPALLSIGDEILATISELKLWEQTDPFLSLERFTFITTLSTDGLNFKEKRQLYDSAIEISHLQDKESIYQVARLDSLSSGNYDGKTTFGTLKNYGNFGLGTFNALDGEMVGVDGQFYQVKDNGRVEAVKKGWKTPFANITHFNIDQEIPGTMVGFRFPEEAAGENVAGFHFHFLTKDRRSGGHLLDGQIKNGTIYIDYSSGIERIDKAKKGK